MIYNLDSYDIKLYNEFLNNLKNHNITFNEYVNTRNYKFYIETNEVPFILNYEELGNTSRMFLIAKVQGANAQDIYNYRRTKISNSKENLKLCINDAFQYFLSKKSEYFYFIHIQNKDKAELLSKEIGRLYYFGSYFNNKYKVYLTNNQYLSNFIQADDILAGSDDLFELEMNINYNIFRLQDRIKKFSQTPYRENGVTILPKYIHPFFKKIK